MNNVHLIKLKQWYNDFLSDLGESPIHIIVKLKIFSSFLSYRTTEITK